MNISESTYILVSELARVRVMESIMNEITPDNECITKDEYVSVVTHLAAWRQRMFEKMKDKINRA